MATARLDRFVRDNFQRLKCNKYVKNQETEERICGCNRDERWHADCGIPMTPMFVRDAPSVDEQQVAPQWDSATCCLRLPTNAHGKIKFRGFGRVRSANCPKFIRLQSTGIDMEALWSLLTDKDKWALPYPDFVLSVNGGAGNFLGFSRKFTEKLKAAVLNLTAGVRKVWIFTHGFNVGVAGQFGQVLERASFVGGDVSNIFLIGISTWGNIYNNQMLEDDDAFAKGGEPLPGEHMRRYDYDKGELDKDSTLKRLDKNHTHFIMVDDGSEGSSGREIQLRTELEKFVVTKMRTIGARSGRPCIPPVVQLSVEGGKYTLLTAAQAAQEGTPVVAVRGSGRAADQLVWADSVRRAPASSRPSETEVRARIKDMIAEFVNTSGPIERRALERALFRFAYESPEAFPIDLLTVFDPLEDTDLSRSVLYLVFRHQDFKDDIMTQVVLAMSWDRADIAESEIFSVISESQLRDLNMNRLFTKALMCQQLGFIELFMDYGVSAVNVLNRERLERLYLKFITQGTQQSERLLAKIIQTRDNMESCKCAGNSPKASKFSKNCGIEQKDILLLIGRIIKTLTNDVLDNIYTEAYLADNPTVDTTKDLYPPRKRDGQRKFNMQDLFIWAILCHNMELAVLFWKNGKNQISTALIGRLLLQHMAEDADANDEMELKSVFEADSQRFEELALGVLAKCYERNRDITKAVLIRELPMWNCQTPLAIAEGSECLDFMHHSSVQDLLTMIWMGGMVTNTATWRIVTCLFLPFLTPFLIFKTHRKFNYMHIHKWCKQERDKLNQSTVSLELQDRARLLNVLEEVQVVDKAAPNTREYLETIMVDEVVESLEVSLKTRQQMRMESLYQKRQGFMNLSFLSCLQLFYMSPLVKCILNCLSTLMFLSMMSYIVLVELGQRCDPAKSLHWTEWFIFMWVLQFMAEEVRQFSHFRSLTTKLKGMSYWDKFDILLCVLFITCVVMRLFFPRLCDWVQCVYAVTLALFFLRFMQFYYVHHTLGPKVLMIIEMFSDVVFFVAILVVIMLAFGVASLSLRDESQKLSGAMIKNMITIPYWQMYGELSLEDIEKEVDNNSVRYVVTLIMLGIYMLGTNVLLLNLLIAMFGNTFERMQTSSFKYWSYIRHDFIKEYYYRPWLPPPAIFIIHIMRLSQLVYYKLLRRHCCKGAPRQRQSDDFAMRLDLTYHLRLQSFEKQITDAYMKDVCALHQEPE